MEYTTAQLEEMVDGNKAKPRAVFFEKAQLDVTASHAAGHRVYVPAVYVKLVHQGVTDSIAYPAQEQDMKEFREEYNMFLQNRQGASRSVSIDIIPNLNIIHRQELVDMGLSSIQRLAAAIEVPPHLEYARKSAIILNQVLQEQENGKGTEDHETRTSGQPGHVHEARRLDDHDHVGRPEATPGDGRREDRVTEGRGEGRRDHGNYPGESAQASEGRRAGSGLFTGGMSNDWSVSFRIR